MIETVERITPAIEAMAGAAGSELSRGGMQTKIEAATADGSALAWPSDGELSALANTIRAAGYEVGALMLINSPTRHVAHATETRVPPATPERDAATVFRRHQALKSLAVECLILDAA